MNCRFCGVVLKYIFADLHETPFANAYLTEQMLSTEEKFPLKAFVCEECFLVQVDKFKNPQNIFKEYAYFSSYSTSWLDHVEKFTNEMIKEFNLSEGTQIVEIACNDGYLLKNFKDKKIPVLGIEPALNVAVKAKNLNIPVVTDFFNSKTAKKIIDSGVKAHFLIAFNVLAQVPDLNDFVLGLSKIIHKNGVIVIQFSAYLLDLIEKCEYDMIYHEHFSYFSLHTLKSVFERYDLEIFDVNKFNVHGGSLRLFIKSTTNNSFKIKDIVNKILTEEEKFGLKKLLTYTKFQKNIDESKKNIQEFFISTKQNNKKIVCYGAAAKGNTILNFCNIGKKFIDYVVDINIYKQGKFLPGTHLPILSPDKIKDTKPDYVVILAWNLKVEIMEQISYINEWGGKFVLLIPEVKILN